MNVDAPTALFSFLAPRPPCAGARPKPPRRRHRYREAAARERQEGGKGEGGYAPAAGGSLPCGGRGMRPAASGGPWPPCAGMDGARPAVGGGGGGGGGEKEAWAGHCGLKGGGTLRPGRRASGGGMEYAARGKRGGEASVLSESNCQCAEAGSRWLAAVQRAIRIVPSCDPPAVPTHPPVHSGKWQPRPSRPQDSCPASPTPFSLVFVRVSSFEF